MTVWINSNNSHCLICVIGSVILSTDYIAVLKSLSVLLPQLNAYILVVGLILVVKLTLTMKYRFSIHIYGTGEFKMISILNKNPLNIVISS